MRSADKPKYRMAVAKYLAFAAFIIFAGTGIAVGYTGGSLLTAYVAYLSPWLPKWLWMAVSTIMTLGVAITATSTAGAISTLAPNPKAFKTCLSLLLLMVVSELAGTLIVYRKQNILGDALSCFMKTSMRQSSVNYGSNLSNTQLWDEIQKEMNCCGVDNYKDWFGTDFGNGTNVPDSCCLLIEEGCGQGISNVVDPADDIITQGCLPTILTDISLDYHTLSKGVWLPVCVMHVALIVLLIASSMFLQEDHYTATNLQVYSVTTLQSSPSHKYSQLEEC